MSKQRNKGETRRGDRSRGEEQTAQGEPTRSFGQTFHTAVTISNKHRRRRRLKIRHRGAHLTNGYVLADGANGANGAIGFSLREHGKALGPLCQSTTYECACTRKRERSRMRQANASVVRTARQRGLAQIRAWMSSPDLQLNGTYNRVIFLYNVHWGRCLVPSSYHRSLSQTAKINPKQNSTAPAWHGAEAVRWEERRRTEFR
jgi:hypothetical protein